MTAKDKSYKVDETGALIVPLPYSRQSWTLRRPKVRDMEAIELAAKDGASSNIGTTVTALAILTEQPKEAVEDLDLEDMEVLSNALTSFPVFRDMVKR